jgi:CRP-like cAMP-binding protein
VASFEKSLYLGYLAGVPMFSACSAAELDQVADRATVRAVPDGASLVMEGEPGQEFFVISSGKAKVMRQNEEVATLGQGDFFGELALFHDAPRNASVVASGQVSAIVLARGELSALLGEVSSMRDSLLRGMSRRLHELDARV